MPPNENPEEQIGKLSRRSLLWGAGATLLTGGILRYIVASGDDKGIPHVLRAALGLDEAATRAYFNDQRLSPTFDASQIDYLRINGQDGLSTEVTAAYRIKVISRGKEVASVSMAELKALPRVEMITELRCVEGWSRVWHWAGARFSDFAAKYAPGDDSPYIGMETPDKGYYVGLDRAACFHPQTLLCYEMNHAPLSPAHGAPVRLAMPVKYGYKQLKQIGVVKFADERPPDFWGERGYDWYGGM